MVKTDLTKKTLPDSPGVYFFLGARKEILYIGKATSLRNRIRSYFTNDLKEKRSQLIENMVTESKSVEWTITDSVLEALILETNLIRTHKPRFNTISKDDKSYNHLIITNEEWPRVLLVRGKDLTEKYTKKEIKCHFGPFPSGGQLRSALRIVRKLFRYYDSKKPIGQEKSKIARGQIDFNRQIGLYPNHGDKKEYQKTIRHLRLFFEGRKGQIIKELEKEMKAYAKAEEFEKAELSKRKIFALQHIQDVALIKDDSRIYRDDKRLRIEGYDVAHLGGKDMVGVMTVVESGEAIKNEYRKFKINTVKSSNDTAALKEMLERRLDHPEWPFPQVVVVDGGKAQKNTAEAVLKKRQLVIPVIAVTKDERHKPKSINGDKNLIKNHENEILLVNAEAHRFSITYHRHKRQKRL